VQQKYQEYNKELQREKGICEQKYESRKTQLKNLDDYLAKQSLEFAHSKEEKKPSFFKKLWSGWGSKKK
jgi:site-specific recombinase XerD